MEIPYKKFEGVLTFEILQTMVENWKEKGIDPKTPIFIERVEDVYFEKHGWETSDYLFPLMSDEQKFFRSYWAMYHDGKILIHAHY